MPKYIGDVINSINYNGNFNFNIDELPNPCKQNDNKACAKYKQNIDKHIDKVINVWFKSIGEVETTPTAKGLTEHATNYYGDYLGSSTFIHKAQSLRDIAKNEFNVPSTTLADIDRIIQMHDRSRYSEDEFYGQANYMFGTPDEKSRDIASLKHFHRNAHEISYYVFFNELGGVTRKWFIDDCGDDEHPSTGHWEYIYKGYTVPMPEVFAWVRVAVWLAEIGDTDYKHNYPLLRDQKCNPFQYFWRRDSNAWIEVIEHEKSCGESGTVTWKTYKKHYIDWNSTVSGLELFVPMHLNTRLILAKIVDRWSLYVETPEDEEEPNCPVKY